MKTPSEERLKEPGVRPPQPPHPEEGPCVQLWARPSKEEMDKREGSREEPACKEKGGARPRERHLPPAQPFLFQGKKAAGGREQRGRRRPSSARGCSASGRRKGGRAQPETLGPRPALSGDGGSIAFSCPPPHGAELRSGGFAAAGPGGAGRGGGLDGALPGGPGLGEPPAPVQRPPALHDPRDGLPSGGCPPGLPHLQDGEQAGHQGAPWPPPCPGPPRGAGRAGGRLPVPQEDGLPGPLQPPQLVWPPGLCLLHRSVADGPGGLPLPRGLLLPAQPLQAAARLLRGRPLPALHCHRPPGHPRAPPLQDQGQVQCLCPRGAAGQRLGAPAGGLWGPPGLHPDAGGVAAAPPGRRNGPLHGLQETGRGGGGGRGQPRGPPLRAPSPPLPGLPVSVRLSAVDVPPPVPPPSPFQPPKQEQLQQQQH
ncbi:collagen alpha-1(I) chain isoform X2 [Anolis carolinensis]|uniref:collagen alpha-1(I) chain isoform X2 n=1 Tax=Anolis carolinensis TaxID=28377 RepID=UPI002F2B59DE